ncbi:hypothetical protein V6259_17960 [Marinomonas sp. TI.3.20]|uniref:hypothetical protein n=1 Tax=Marinomonas sp. TI.3.20 TaxID=3121296 RepID=UPI00311DE28C
MDKFNSHVRIYDGQYQTPPADFSITPLEFMCKVLTRKQVQLEKTYFSVSGQVHSPVSFKDLMFTMGSVFHIPKDHQWQEEIGLGLDIYQKFLDKHQAFFNRITTYAPYKAIVDCKVRGFLDGLKVYKKHASIAAIGDSQSIQQLLASFGDQYAAPSGSLQAALNSSDGSGYVFPIQFGARFAKIILPLELANEIKSFTDERAELMNQYAAIKLNLAAAISVSIKKYWAENLLTWPQHDINCLASFGSSNDRIEELQDELEYNQGLVKKFLEKDIPDL